MTYEELCSFEVLYKAYLEARKGKRSKSKTIEYEAQALACTEKLSRKLAVRDVRQPGGDIRQQICYVPSKFEVFAVYEPKRRMVHAPAFVDKVVLHALVDNILYDALTRSFIRDSHASQTGKGTDDGRYAMCQVSLRFSQYTNQRNGWYMHPLLSIKWFCTRWWIMFCTTSLQRASSGTATPARKARGLMMA